MTDSNDRIASLTVMQLRLLIREELELIIPRVVHELLSTPSRRRWSELQTFTWQQSTSGLRTPKFVSGSLGATHQQRKSNQIHEQGIAAGMST